MSSMKTIWAIFPPRWPNAACGLHTFFKGCQSFLLLLERGSFIMMFFFTDDDVLLQNIDKVRKVAII